MRQFLLTCCLAALFLSAPDRSAFADRVGDGDRVSYRLGLNELETDLSLISTTAMPGAELRIRVEANASADRGTLSPREDGWAWRAPETPGPARLSFERGGERRTLVVFVLTPFENGRDSSLRGFKIGNYSTSPFRGLSSYRAPTGMIEVTPALREMAISPNFTLGQFLCKQQPGHDPTFVLIRPAMLAKLEALLDAVQSAGHEVDTLTVMSGFRTPWYNASIGNRTTSSRHLFGGAADVFVDADGNGWMDDLNGDGAINVKDAELLASMAEQIARRSERAEWPAGGIGIYRANSVRGPFVHVDARGYQARW